MLLPVGGSRRQLCPSPLWRLGSKRESAARLRLSASDLSEINSLDHSTCKTRLTYLESLGITAGGRYRLNQSPYSQSTASNAKSTSHQSLNMPRGAKFSFAYNSIVLDHQAIQTRKAMSRVKANYHLFLRNQPRAPQLRTQDLGPPRKWQVPRMKNLEE